MSEIKTEVALKILDNIKSEFDSFVIEKEEQLLQKTKCNIMASVKFIVSLITLELFLIMIFACLAYHSDMNILKIFVSLVLFFGIIGSIYDFFKWIKLKTGFYNPLSLSKNCRRKKYWKLFKNKAISVNLLSILKCNMEETYVISLIHKHNFNITYKDLTDDLNGLKIKYEYWQMAKTIYDCIE